MEYDYFEVWGIEIGYKKNGAYIPLRSESGHFFFLNSTQQNILEYKCTLQLIN